MNFLLQNYLVHKAVVQEQSKEVIWQLGFIRHRSGGRDCLKSRYLLSKLSCRCLAPATILVFLSGKLRWSVCWNSGRHLSSVPLSAWTRGNIDFLLLLLLHLPRPSRPQNSPARSREPSFFPSFLSFCIFDLAWWWPLTLRRLFYLLILFSCAPLPHSSVFLCIRLLFGGSSNSQLNAPLTPPPLLSLSLTFFPSRATSPFDLFPQIRSTGPNWSQLLTSSFHL